jgi:hypothetical protein
VLDRKAKLYQRKMTAGLLRHRRAVLYPRTGHWLPRSQPPGQAKGVLPQAAAARADGASLAKAHWPRPVRWSMPQGDIVYLHGRYWHVPGAYARRGGRGKTSSKWRVTACAPPGSALHQAVPRSTPVRAQRAGQDQRSLHPREPQCASGCTPPSARRWRGTSPVGFRCTW